MKSAPARLPNFPLPLLTPHLRLEQPSMRRIEEYPPLLGDRSVSRWLLRVPSPYRRSDAREHVLRARRRRREGTDLALAIVDRATDCLIGGIGLHGIDVEHGHGEIGYWIGRPYWGRGYASEAVGAVVDACFLVLRLHRVEAGVFRGNSGSENVLRKAGFHPEGVRREAFLKDGAWMDDLLFGLTETDWRRRRSQPHRVRRTSASQRRSKRSTS
jgi:[ribosomal protein S5]-alanine N-acetyltransferase